MKWLFVLLALLTLPMASAFSLSAYGWGPYGTINTQGSEGWGSLSTTPRSIVTTGGYNGFSYGMTFERPAYTTYSMFANPNQNYRTIAYDDWTLTHASTRGQGYAGAVARMPNGQYAADIAIGGYTRPRSGLSRYSYGSFGRNTALNHWGMYGWQTQQVGGPYNNWNYAYTGSAFSR